MQKENLIEIEKLSCVALVLHSQPSTKKESGILCTHAWVLLEVLDNKYLLYNHKGHECTC